MENVLDFQLQKTYLVPLFCQVALQYTREYGPDKVRVMTLVKNRGKGGAVRMVRSKMSNCCALERSTQIRLNRCSFRCLIPVLSHWRELWSAEESSFWWQMLTEPPSFLTLRKWRPLFVTSALNRYESGVFFVFFSSFSCVIWGIVCRVRPKMFPYI